MGNLGALGAKPVMEGYAVLFKLLADVDSLDIELDSEDTEALIEAIAMMEPTFGGINLEDIKAPECFIIEQTLRERMKIPVMHDDQHGTAIIAAAGLVNACLITGRKFEGVKVVVNGAGASAIACTSLIKSMGVRQENVIMCDSNGVVWEGSEGGEQFKSSDPMTVHIWWDKQGNGVNASTLIAGKRADSGGGLVWMDTRGRVGAVA